jgi:hypothetical protein
VSRSRQEFLRGEADVWHFVHVVGAASPEHLAGEVLHISDFEFETSDFLQVGPVGEAFGPEFKARKQAVDVRHTERHLEELGSRTTRRFELRRARSVCCLRLPAASLDLMSDTLNHFVVV